MIRETTLVRTGPRYGPRCLADLVPLEGASSVLVVGRARDLRSYLVQRGVEPVVVGARRERLPRRLDVADGAHDLVFVPRARRRDLPALREMSRVLAPGGRLVVGVQRARLDSLPGMATVRVYGVRKSVRSPRYMVPLDHPRAIGWFARSVYVPTSTSAALGIRLAGVLPAAIVARLLFDDVVLVGRKAPSA